MKAIRLYFFKGTGLISRLIQLKTFSRFSHVAIGIDGLVYEANIGQGVVLSKSPHTYNTAEDETLTLYVDIYKEKEMIGFLNRQIGKRYDLMAIFSFFRNENNQNDSGKWFCSELASIALSIGGVIPKPKKLYSPGSLYDSLVVLLWNETNKLVFKCDKDKI